MERLYATRNLHLFKIISKIFTHIKQKPLFRTAVLLFVFSDGKTVA